MNTTTQYPAAQPAPAGGAVFPAGWRQDMVVWICILGAVAGTVGVLAHTGTTMATTLPAVLGVSPVVLLTMVIYGLVLVWADPYRSRRWWPFVAAAVLGATVPTALSLIGNQAIDNLLTATLDDATHSAWGSALSAPLMEEYTKDLTIVALLLVWPWARRPMPALVVGGAVGLGFQTMENVIYVARAALADPQSDASGAWGTALMRLGVGVASHWLLSAIAAVGIALIFAAVTQAKTSTSAWRGGALVLLSMLLHAGWNGLGNNLIAAGVLMVVDVAVFTAVVLYAQRSYRAALEPLPNPLAGTHPAPEGITAEDLGAWRGTWRQRAAARRRVRAAHGRTGLGALRRAQREQAAAARVLLES